MNNFKFELNQAGVRELMQSSEMAGIVRDYAQQVCSAAGDGFEVETGKTPTRTKAKVRASTPEAYYRCLNGNVLLKALGGIKR